MEKLFKLLVCFTAVGFLGVFLGAGMGLVGQAQARGSSGASLVAITSGGATMAEKLREAGSDQTLARPGMLPAGRVQAATIITPEIVSSFPVPGNRARSLAWGNSSLWLADVDKNVYRLDVNGVVQETFPITVTAYDLAWFENSLWAHDGYEVYQLNSSGQVSSTLNVGYWSNGAIEWVGNDLYVTDYNFGDVHKHNRLGMHLLSWGTSFFGHPTGLTYDGTGLWVGDSCEGGYNQLYRYSLTGTLLSSIDLDLVGIPCDVTQQNTRGLAWDGQYLWYTSDELFTVYRLDINPPPPPTLSLISPDYALDTAGNVPVTITGTNFRPPVSAWLETAGLLSVTLQSSNTLQAVVPVGSLSQGVYDLTVSSGGKIATLPAAFTLKPAYIPPSPPDETWTFLGLDFNEIFGPPNGIGSITVDPHNSNVIYASDDNGSSSDQLRRTTDGGQTWQVFRNESASSVAIHPADSNTLYVARGYGSSSINKTINGGLTWTEISCCGGYGYRNAIIINPANPDTVYLGISRLSTNTPGVYKSTNGGSSWSNILNEVNVLALTFDPTNPNILYAAATDTDWMGQTVAGSGGVYKSSDAGITWSQVMTHTRVNAVAIDAQNPQTLYAATEGSGIFKSINGGGSWFRANTGLSHLIVRALAISSEYRGVLYAGLWEGGVFRSLDGGASWQPINTGLTNLYINSLAIDPQQPDIMYAGTDGKGIFKWSGPPPPPLGSTYAKVVNENGYPLKGVQVYRNGNAAPGVTDSAGNLVLDGVHSDDTLVALTRVYTQPTARQGHGGWAYQVYQTSLNVSPNGTLQPFTLINPTGPQTLTVKSTNILVLFNLLVSIEWDAGDEYIAQIERAVRSASDYLYDYTDGQMAFGQVAIYDNGQYWAEADLQISTQNVVRPHAYIGGITSTDKSHVMRIGRFWDGNSGNQGAWDQPEGYRTLAHEFGHYALHLYDEYFAYTFGPNGNLTGEVPALCTGPENRNPASEASNASVMDYQYSSSELSARNVPGLWSSLCEQTAQWQLNHESPWETLVRKYGDTTSPLRWQLSSPLSRGSLMVGPADLPDTILALPLVSQNNGGASGSSRLLTVYSPTGQGYWGAIVALYKQGGRVIGQGFTNSNGRLEIYGAETGDIVRVASFDGGLAGSVNVGTEPNLSMTLAPVGGLTAQETGSIPHMQVRANPGSAPNQIELFVALHNFGPNADPSVIVTEPGSEAGYAPTLSYSPASGAYEGQISFSATEQGMGRVRAVGSVGSSLVRLQSTYRLQRVSNNQGGEIFSNDGNLSLYLKSDSLPGSDAYFVVMPPGAIPGAPPAGLILVGDPYDLTASGALAELSKSGVLSLRYDGALVNTDVSPEGLGIYRWEPNSGVWQAVGGNLDEEHKAMAAPVTVLGVYALLAPPGSWQEPSKNHTFLPLITKAAH